MKKIMVFLSFFATLLLLSSCTVPAYYQLEVEQGKPSQASSSSPKPTDNYLPDYFDAADLSRLEIAEGYKSTYRRGEDYVPGDQVLVFFVSGKQYRHFIAASDIKRFSSAKLGIAEVVVDLGPIDFVYFVNIVL